MKLCYKYTLVVLAALATLVGCANRSEGDTAIGQTITLNVSLPQTRAMLDQSSFGAEGNRIKVYDFVDGVTEAHINSWAGPDVQSNSTLHESGTTWPFTDNINGTTAVSKTWTPGTHRFFGWLAKDATLGTADDFFGGLSFNSATKVLTIPAKEMAADVDQLDFLYSDVTTTEPTNLPVKMSFNHLFAAVSFGVKNTTSSPILVEVFNVENIPNIGSATINFSGSAPVVTYSDPTNAVNPIFRGLTAPYTLDGDDGTGSNVYSYSNIFEGDNNQEFMMLWPLESSKLYSDEKVTEEGGVVTYPTSYKMYVKYTAEGQDYEKRINFPKDLSWEAGKKYHFDIIFADKTVELKTRVNPWILDEQDIDYTDKALSMGEDGKLKWNNEVSSVSDVDKEVLIINAQPANADFTIATPVGGSWIVSLVGDVNAFEVSPSSGVIDGTTTAHVYVKPLVASPARAYKVKLKFAVRRPDGRMLSADEEVQGKDNIYTVVLPQNN